MRFLLVLLSAALLASCAKPPRSEANAGALRFISLNPCTDAILAEVADPAQILAISHYSHDPRASSMEPELARQFRVTGGTVEEVLALNPDIVLAGTYLPPATRTALERLGIRVETFGIASSAEQSERQVRRLAAITGHDARGEALIARINAALEATRSSAKPVSTLLWQHGGIVAGDRALAAQVLTHTGFASHAAARGLGQGAYVPLEQVLADPPELVLAAGAGRLLAHPVLRRLDSTVYESLDPALLYCGGPTIIRLSERLAAIRGELQ